MGRRPAASVLSWGFANRRPRASFGSATTMTARKRTRAEGGILASVHETAVGLHKAGVIDKATMREFDELRLTPVEAPTPAEIRALRERGPVSQGVADVDKYAVGE